MEAIGQILSTVFIIGFVVLIIASLWKVFEKAGEPGWAAIIPFYNIYIMLKIAGKPAWWLVGFIIPIVSIVVSVLVCISLAKSFGKETLFGVGLALLGFIFFPILGFGDAEYQGPRPADELL